VSKFAAANGGCVARVAQEIERVYARAIGVRLLSLCPLRHDDIEASQGLVSRLFAALHARGQRLWVPEILRSGLQKRCGLTVS
jgi:predicted xylose isomerase-like sugar epimerase